MSEQPEQAATASHTDEYDDAVVAMLVVLENGELRPGFYRGHKPA